MTRHMIYVACLTAMLGIGAPATAQIGDAVKHVGQATVDTTKEAGKKTAEGVKKGTAGTVNAVNGRPLDATGRCHDGTYTTAKTKNGACKGHGGVVNWY